MSAKVGEILDEMSNTLFVAAGLEFVEGLLKLGVVRHGIFARCPRRLRPLLNDSILIHEDNVRVRSDSVSNMLIKNQSFLNNHLNTSRNIWSFLPGAWAEQFRLMRHKVLNWNYYEYIFWSGKLHQEQLLLKYADEELASHLKHKHRVLNRQIILSSQIDEKDESLIYFKPNSISGQGVFISGDEITFSDELLVRVEKKVWPHIPICQIAVTDGKVTTSYAPSIMIIKTKEGHLDYHGSDFNISNFLPPEAIKEVDRLTRTVGKALSRAGFKGIYNCDYIFCPTTKKVFFVEVNPRNSGCSFIIDNAFAEKFIAGNQQAIRFMPTFLNFQTYLFNDIGPELDRFIPYEEIFEGVTVTTAFSHVFESDYSGHELNEFEDFSSNLGVQISSGDIIMTVAGTKQMIIAPEVPTRLTDCLETFFLQAD